MIGFKKFSEISMCSDIWVSEDRLLINMKEVIQKTNNENDNSKNDNNNSRVLCAAGGVGGIRETRFQ